MPLLVLVLQGLVFSFLLLKRYYRTRNSSDLFLALILLITCWHQTMYTIGFMAWYDTFRNTKINYFLIDLTLATGPLIYFYVRSITESLFQFRKKDFFHFLPVLLFIVLSLVVFSYDSIQAGFAQTQNGYLKEQLMSQYVDPLLVMTVFLQKVVYLAFSLQIFYRYRHNIQQVFSNLYLLELTWLRNFLFLYTFLFLYGIVQSVIDVAITDLSWTQEWWYYFVSALVIIYVGIKGYFTDTTALLEVEFDQRFPFHTSHNIPQSATLVANKDGANDPLPVVSSELFAQREILGALMENERPYLNPDLNLQQLAKSLGMTRAQLSEIINSGYQKNFNDFINQYRVESVISMLKEGKQEQLSLLGIAYDSGFSSKATFNRVFKKLTGASPSNYLNGD